MLGIMGIGFGGTPLGARIEVLQINEQGSDLDSVSTMPLPDGMEAGRFRSVVMGPDGSLYAAVDGGTIHKITP